MGRIDTSYEPFDPLNICSICGTLERKKRLKRLPGGLFACSRPGCANERTALELDRANARQRPFRILPVPNARPQTWNLPDSYEGDEGEILNFLARAVANQARYESVSGGTPAPLAGQMLPAFGWIGRYLYGMIVEDKRPHRMLDQAIALLLSVATAVRTRQRGFGISSGGRAVDPWYGGFLESGATSYVTDDAAGCGLVLLYAYRVFGTGAYLDSARAAANYLRNVQAIGKYGTNFTSSDAAGTSRLYTGAVASEVSTTIGIDPGELFYANHLFYPSGLVAMEFWKELQTTDGDQSIGATGTASDAFIAAPTQLISTCISDMRACWSNGIRDSANETFSGLSASTPREYFNAYPASKNGFQITGTGRWEFLDGGASTGTTVSSQNFASAIGSLYAYEGASEQVTSVSAWLRGFTSNPQFEAGENESISEAARVTTGDYDATLAPSTILLVRDADNLYSAIAQNGSSLYDWGAFGCLSALWGATFSASFIQSRLSPLGRNQRFYDGTRSDGDHFDWITNRGLSGLRLQTAFQIDLSAGNNISASSSSGYASVPSGAGLVYWIKGDAGLVDDGAGMMVSWANQATLGSNPALFAEPGGYGAFTGQDSLNGIPGLNFPVTQPNIIIGLGTGSHVAMKGSTGAKFGYGAGEVQARTVIFVCRPRTGNFFNICGGTLCRFGTTTAGAFQDFEALFDLEPLVQPDDFYLFSNNWRNGFANALKGPDTTRATYNGVPIIVEHASSGYPNISVRVNNTEVTLTPSAFPVEDAGHPLNDFFTLGTVNQVGDTNGQWHGAIFEGLIYDHVLAEDERTQTYSYLSGRFQSTGVSDLAMVNDAVRAAQFARCFRVNPVFPMSV